MEDAKTILNRWGEMESARAPWDANWRLVANYAMPRHANGLTKGSQSAPSDNPANRLYDTTAIESTATLANGHSSQITPAGTRWMTWAAPERIQSERADSWYAEKSEIALKILAGSNFYTVVNEGSLERSGFGLCNIAAMPSTKTVVTFQAHPVGSFCIDEDADGNVDTVFLKKTWGIRQICQYFGDEVIAQHEKLAKSYDEFVKKGVNREHHVINAVFPRLKRQEKKIDKLNMPFASIWIACEDKGLMLEKSGSFELPYCVSRYLKRTGSGQQYGYSPFDQCRAAVRDANLLREVANVVAQRLGVPSILIPDDLVGQVDTRPGGRTVFKSGSTNLPQEWMTKGNLEGILENLEDRRRVIREVYHTDLFKMFAQIERQMTAREVAERSAEKLAMFAPVFTQFTADFQVLMERVFAILFRAGLFGKPQDLPPEVVVQSPSGQYEVLPPKVVYQSRIALALQQAENAAADRMIERAVSLVSVAPDALDNIDLDAYVRTTARNDGVPEAMLRKEDDRDKMREARAKRQEEEAKMQQAAMAAKAAGDLKGANMV